MVASAGPADSPDRSDRRQRALLTLTALGVVYGDIGTSPLYALRECFYGDHGIAVSDANVLGVLSLVTWSLTLVISVKYLLFVLRADDQGEGGILALMELVRRPLRGRWRRLALTCGLFGAALLYGDGMITPAISVLSAIEGLEVATPVFASYVLPLTVAVLIGLFLVQRLGTGGIGRVFGPVMVVWFATLAVLGGLAIVHQPEVLWALSPLPGLSFLAGHGTVGLGILGIVFLVVTGGEALYADIGHFGAGPIRLGWYTIVLPCLLLNYYGQGALILSGGAELSNPFYQLAPSWLLYPLVVLATMATVIASQAIISGAFSLTFQASRLGYLPRVQINHTSHEQRGQIYVPAANWVLLAATIGLVLGFRRSGNLAAAYGVAIAATMVITTLLFLFAMRRVFEWSPWLAALVTAGFAVVDLAFLAANLPKIPDGGWFPLAVAALVFLVMATWRRGYAAQRRHVRNRAVPVRQLLADIGGGGTYRRVPGQAVYLSGNPQGTPHPLIANVTHNHALHSEVVIYTARYLARPYVAPEDHLKVVELRADIHRVVAYYGFMEDIDVPRDLAGANLGLDLDRVTYFVGDEVILPEDSFGMSRWRSRLFALMARNHLRASRSFRLPPDQVLEIGTHVRV